MEEEKNGEEEPVKETVKRVFTKLEESGWISEVYTPLTLHKMTVLLIESSNQTLSHAPNSVDLTVKCLLTSS
jgi:hypothetical protein